MKKFLLSAQLIICLGFVCCIPQMLLGQLLNYVPTNGLVGYWPFNGNANDESGNGNNGTVNGATLTTDRFGVANKAYSFDGVDDYITIPRNTVFTDEISISGWIYCSSVSGKRDIVTNWQSPPSQRLINLYIENGLLITSIQPSSQVYATSNFLSIGEWKFVCSTFDGQNVKVYVDGQLSVTTASPSSNLAINQRPNWFVGAAEDNASIIEFFLGKIDDIGIWNRALTQQEITNLYNSQTLPTCSVTATNNTICAGASTTLTASSSASNAAACASGALPSNLQTGLVAYWPFCGNANDASGNGNNGTVNGANLTTDRFGNANSAYSFNGTSDFISVPTSYDLNLIGSFTLSSWVKLADSNISNPNYEHHFILSKNAGITGQGTWHMALESALNQPFQIHYNADPCFCLNTMGGTSSQINDINWHIIGVSYNSVNQELKYYLDGNLVFTSFQFNYSNQITAYNLLIGKENVGLQGFFNGKLDDIAIYNRVLSAAEIQQLYNQGQTTYSWSNGATTPSITVSPTQTTTYTCTVTANGTSCSSDFTVTVNPLPTVNAGNDQTVCAGTAVTLSGTGANTYSWNNSVSNGVAFTPASTATYTVTGTNTATGCTNTDQVVVNVNALPTVNAGNDQTVCAGTAITLSGTGASTYSWNNSVSNGVAFTPASTTTYTVTGTNTATGCTNTDQVVVNVNALPTVNAGNDQTVCTGTAVTLSGTGANTYSWNNNVSNGVAFTPAATATYTVTGTDANNCTNTDEVLVTVNALPSVSAGPDQELCQGQSTSLFATGASTYAWSNNVSNGVGFLPTATQVYTVTGTNSSTGCTNVDTVVVTVNALPTVSAGVDQTVCKGDSIALSGSGALSYQWDNNVSDGVLFAPQTTQTYVVTGTDANGCVDTDDVTVTVNQSSFSTLTETALDSYTLNGQTYTQSGTYTQVVSNAAGCDSTITLNLTLNFTGIEELTHSVVLSPNPTFGSLTISSVDALNENYILFDAQGRKLVTGTLKGTATTIDLTSLARGNYLLMIGEKSVYKVVKE